VQLLHHLPLQTEDGCPEVPSAWDADRGVRRDAAGADWPQMRFAPGSDLVLDPAPDHWDAGAEKLAYRAPAFRAAELPQGAVVLATAVARRRRDGARFEERSIYVVVVRAGEG
jgi:hypothetical protein